MTNYILTDYGGYEINTILSFKKDLSAEYIQNTIHQLADEWYDNEKEYEKKYWCYGEWFMNKLHDCFEFEEINLENERLYW